MARRINKGEILKQDGEKLDRQNALQAAFIHATEEGVSIVNAVLEQNREFFAVNPEMNDRVIARLQKGRDLVKLKNYRAADAILRHAIDLILQEDHRVFKDSAKLRARLLRYRDYHKQVITPLWHNQKKQASEE